MIIYRVEDENTDGPYMGHPAYFNFHRRVTVHCNMDTHPTPSVDHLPNGYCGFVSLTQFYHWFKGDIKTLAKQGFQLAVLELDDLSVNIGQHQVTFPTRDAAHLVRTYSLRYACDLAREEMENDRS